MGFQDQAQGRDVENTNTRYFKTNFLNAINAIPEPVRYEKNCYCYISSIVIGVMSTLSFFNTKNKQILITKNTKKQIKKL